MGTDSVSKATVRSPKATSNPITITGLPSGDDSSAAPEDLRAVRSPEGEAESPDANTNTPPFGYLLAPRSDAKVGGTVAVVGGAFDKEDSTLPVTILLDGAPIGSLIVTIGTPLNTGPERLASADYSTFSFDWDTATTTVGPHTLAIQATDSEGASAIIGIRRITLIQ